MEEPHILHDDGFIVWV